jgi:hypothetical protein
MFLRIFAVLGTVTVLIIAYVAWTRNTQKPAPTPMQTEAPEAGSAPASPPPGDASSGAPQGGASGGAVPPVVRSASDPGLEWTAPKGWTNQGASMMRLATYVFHGPRDTEAQCAVYYFGPGQGGSVEANLERWQREFKDAKLEAPRNFNAPGARVTMVSIQGTYMAHVGMLGAGSSTEMPHWALLGAIAEGPNGSVFFKFTGPQDAVKAAAPDFERMLKGIHRGA